MVMTNVTVSVDEQDKIAFDSLCKNAGLNTSMAINLFMKAALCEKRILFEISQFSDPFYSAANRVHLMKAVHELREGKGQAHELMENDND